MRVLVIGGTGFIGAELVKQLASAGHTVCVFHRGITPIHALANVTSMIGDRAHLPDYRARFHEFRPDVVVDMIAMTERDAHSFVEAFREPKVPTVLISSGDVYRTRDRLFKRIGGAVEDSALTEESPLRSSFYPYRQYARAAEDWLYAYDKILVERIILHSGIPTVILRLPMVYGPGDKQRRVWEYLQKMEDGPPFIAVNAQRADWRCTRAYVENVARRIATVATTQWRDSSVFNVGGVTLTESEWIESIGRAAKWLGRIVRVPETLPTEPDLEWTQSLVIRGERLQETFGQQEEVPFSVGLERTVEWERA
jgi:nucleoside-diphosphate-sugar epimerase